MRLALALAAATLAPLVTASGCEPAAHAPPRPSTIDERQACTADADCAVVELSCCDHCNGGTVVGVHKDHAADVRAEHVPPSRCADVACTLMACAAAEPICRAGRCGISLNGEESLPDLPANPAP